MSSLTMTWRSVTYEHKQFGCHNDDSTAAGTELLPTRRSIHIVRMVRMSKNDCYFEKRIFLTKIHVHNFSILKYNSAESARLILSSLLENLISDE